MNTKKTIYDFAHLFLRALYRNTIHMDIRQSHTDCQHTLPVDVKLLLEYAEKESFDSYNTKGIR
jgi:hypothetical protein